MLELGKLENQVCGNLFEFMKICMLLLFLLMNVDRCVYSEPRVSI